MYITYATKSTPKINLGRLNSITVCAPLARVWPSRMWCSKKSWIARRRLGCTWPLDPQCTDTVLKQMLYPRPLKPPEPDWGAIHRKLERKDVTWFVVVGISATMRETPISECLLPRHHLVESSPFISSTIFIEIFLLPKSPDFLFHIWRTRVTVYERSLWKACLSEIKAYPTDGYRRYHLSLHLGAGKGHNGPKNSRYRQADPKNCVQTLVLWNLSD